MQSKTILTTGMVVAALLSGCSNMRSGQSMSAYPSASPTAAASNTQGVIESIQLVRSDATGTMGAGALMGGAVGGAVMGNEMEQNRRYPQESYQVTVRLDDGSYRSVNQDSIADLRVGSRVRLENERVFRY